MEQELEALATLYALSIKGGYYTANGEITDDLSQAKFFSSPEEAKDFRRAHDPRHRIDQSILLHLVAAIYE